MILAVPPVLLAGQPGLVHAVGDGRDSPQGRDHRHAPLPAPATAGVGAAAAAGAVDVLLHEFGLGDGLVLHVGVSVAGRGIALKLSNTVSTTTYLKSVIMID